MTDTHAHRRAHARALHRARRPAAARRPGVVAGAAHVGRRPARAHRAIVTVSRPLGDRAAEPVGDGRRHAAGLRLRRLRPERYYRWSTRRPTPATLAGLVAAVMPDTEPVHQHTAAASTTAPGCRSRSCIPRPTSRSCSSRCPPTTRAACSTSAGASARCATRACSSSAPASSPTACRSYASPVEGGSPGWSATSTVGRRGARRRRRRHPRRLPQTRPGMPYAHPTVEHFTPLFVTLGARHRPVGAARRDDRRLLDGPVQALRPGRLTSYAVSAPAARMREAPPHLCAAGPRGFRGDRRAIRVRVGQTPTASRRAVTALSVRVRNSTSASSTILRVSAVAPVTEVTVAAHGTLDDLAALGGRTGDGGDVGADGVLDGLATLDGHLGDAGRVHAHGLVGSLAALACPSRSPRRRTARRRPRRPWRRRRTGPRRGS